MEIKRLVLLMLLALPVMVQAQFIFVTNNGALTITVYTEIDGDVVIPTETNGYPIVGIGEEAFAWSAISSVSIPSSVTRIGKRAFIGCGNLTNISVSKSNSAYADVDGVLFNKNQSALIQCPGGKAGSYTIPPGVETLEAQSFSDCYNLSGVTIPGSTSMIGTSAFQRCDNLMEITVDASNSSYCSVAGILFDASQTALIRYPGGRVGTYVISNCVTSIEDDSFSTCHHLTGLTIPNSVTNIGKEAFISCVALSSISIPESVKRIGKSAFDSCDNMTSIFLPNSITKIEDYTCYGCYSLTNVVIPNNVSRIGNEAFRSCLSLISVDIPNNVTSIGMGTFYDCENLTYVTIGYRVANIEEFAFSYCNLTGVYFRGNAPDLGPHPSDLLAGSGQAVVYYLPGTRGWDTTFASRQTTPWLLPNPTILSFGPDSGVQTTGFGFIISWATNGSVVVEGCTELGNPSWQPVQTNTLLNGSTYFNDPLWTNYSVRFYRVRSP